MSFKEKVKNNPSLKTLAISLLQPRNQHRPRWWVRKLWNPFVHKKGKGTVIRRRTRIDVMPYNRFVVGKDVLIEDFATINNIVGDVVLGDRVLIGLSSVIIGPVTMGDDIMLAQHVVASGLNHVFDDVTRPISQQGVTTAPINIESGAWIGANAVITPGVTIGRNSIVAAGSVVLNDVPPFSIVAGNPAKLKKQFNLESREWEKVTPTLEEV